MDFVVVPFAGDRIDAVVDLAGTRELPMVVVADDQAWSRFDRENPIGPSRVWTPAQHKLTVAAADLRRIDPADEVLEVVARILADPGEVIALHDSDRWRRDAAAEVVERLQEHGRRVAFFTRQSANLGVVADVSPVLALVGDDRDTTVIGLPRSAVDNWEGRVHQISDARELNVGEIVTSYRQSAPIVTARWLHPTGYSQVHVHDRGTAINIIGGIVGDVVARETPINVFNDEEPPDDPGTETQAPIPPMERAVNAWVVLPGEDDSVDVSAPLAVTTDYEVLVNIGEPRAGSLLPRPDARWPSENLPGGDLTLRAVLDLGGDRPPLVAGMTLPASGESFTCDCPIDADVTRHDATCARRPFVRFAITTPYRPIVWTGQLIIYYHVVPVHSQQLVLPVATATAAGLHALPLHHLTRSFADLGPLSDRTASVFVSDGGSRVVVNGLAFADNPVSIKANAADDAVRAARTQLYDQSFSGTGPTLQSKLDGNYGKDFATYADDLATLARIGWTMYQKMFWDNRIFYTLPQLIRQEAAARGRPPVLNVVDPGLGDPDRQQPVPWSLVYDVPISLTGKYTICESARNFGPGAPPVRTVPATCPEPHVGSTLCPFGFWGLSCVIEQPASTDEVTHTVFDRPGQPPAVAMAADPGLDAGLTGTHVVDLKAVLPQDALTYQEVTGPDQLAAMLADESMDVAYLYCHGGYIKLAVDNRPLPVLQFGETTLSPGDIAGWRVDGRWAYNHWPARKPLVILNGCHTAQLTSATLATFVDAFGNRAGAAGVIGTEVTVEQGMAGWVGRMLLQQLVGDATAGEVVRDVRWRMIAGGNTQAFAYTLYSVAGLRLRPAQSTEG
jgi:hypothetical protein